MIHDKDYMMRQIRQFSELLSKMILGNNEGSPEEIELVMETQLRNIFKSEKETFLKKTKEEILEIISEKEEHHQPEYFEMVGHLFYLENKKEENKIYAENAKTFYELWLQKSGIYSLSTIASIKELNKILEGFKR